MLQLSDRDISIYDCKFQAYIQKAIINLKFPCNFFIQWNSINGKNSVQTQSHIKTRNSTVTFDQILEYDAQLIFDKKKKKFLKKDSLICLNLTSKNRPDQVKLVGRVSIDLSQIINENPYENIASYKLDYCSVQSELRFSIKYIKSVCLNKSVSDLDKSSFHDLYSFKLPSPKNNSPTLDTTKQAKQKSISIQKSKETIKQEKIVPQELINKRDDSLENKKNYKKNQNIILINQRAFKSQSLNSITPSKSQAQSTKKQQPSNKPQAIKKFQQKTDLSQKASSIRNLPLQQNTQKQKSKNLLSNQLLQKQKKQLLQQITLLQTQNKQLKQSLKQKQSLLGQKDKTILTLEQKIKYYQNLIRQTQQFNQQSATLKQTLQQITKQNQQLHKLNQQLIKTNSQLQTLQKDLKQNHFLLNKQIVQLKQKLKSFELIIKQKNMEIDFSNKKIQLIQGNLNYIKSFQQQAVHTSPVVANHPYNNYANISGKQQQNNTLLSKSQEQQIKKRNRNLEVRVDSLLGINKKYMDELLVTKKVNQELSLKLSELNQRLGERKIIKALQGDNKKNNRQGPLNNLSIQQQQRSQLQKQITTLKANQTLLKTTQKHLKEHIVQLQQRIKELQLQVIKCRDPSQFLISQSQKNSLIPNPNKQPNHTPSQHSQKTLSKQLQKAQENIFYLAKDKQNLIKQKDKLNQSYRELQEKLIEAQNQISKLKSQLSKHTSKNIQSQAKNIENPQNLPNLQSEIYLNSQIKSPVLGNRTSSNKKISIQQLKDSKQMVQEIQQNVKNLNIEPEQLVSDPIKAILLAQLELLKQQNVKIYDELSKLRISIKQPIPRNNQYSSPNITIEDQNVSLVGQSQRKQNPTLILQDQTIVAQQNSIKQQQKQQKQNMTKFSIQMQQSAKNLNKMQSAKAKLQTSNKNHKENLLINNSQQQPSMENELIDTIENIHQKHNIHQIQEQKQQVEKPLSVHSKEFNSRPQSPDTNENKQGYYQEHRFSKMEIMTIRSSQKGANLKGTRVPMLKKTTQSVWDVQSNASAGFFHEFENKQKSIKSNRSKHSEFVDDHQFRLMSIDDQGEIQQLRLIIKDLRNKNKILLDNNSHLESQYKILNDSYTKIYKEYEKIRTEHQKSSNQLQKVWKQKQQLIFELMFGKQSQIKKPNPKNLISNANEEQQTQNQPHTQKHTQKPTLPLQIKQDHLQINEQQQQELNSPIQISIKQSTKPSKISQQNSQRPNPKQINKGKLLFVDYCNLTQINEQASHLQQTMLRLSNLQQTFRNSDQYQLSLRSQRTSQGSNNQYNLWRSQIGTIKQSFKQLQEQNQRLNAEINQQKTIIIQKQQQLAVIKKQLQDKNKATNTQSEHLLRLQSLPRDDESKYTKSQRSQRNEIKNNSQSEEQFKHKQIQMEIQSKSSQENKKIGSTSKDLNIKIQHLNKEIQEKKTQNLKIQSQIQELKEQIQMLKKQNTQQKNLSNEKIHKLVVTLEDKQREIRRLTQNIQELQMKQQISKIHQKSPQEQNYDDILQHHDYEYSNHYKASHYLDIHPNLYQQIIEPKNSLLRKQFNIFLVVEEKVNANNPTGTPKQQRSIFKRFDSKRDTIKDNKNKNAQESESVSDITEIKIPTNSDLSKKESKNVSKKIVEQQKTFEVKQAPNKVTLKNIQNQVEEEHQQTQYYSIDDQYANEIKNNQNAQKNVEIEQNLRQPRKYSGQKQLLISKTQNGQTKQKQTPSMKKVKHSMQQITRPNNQNLTSSPYDYDKQSSLSQILMKASKAYQQRIQQLQRKIFQQSQQISQKNQYISDLQTKINQYRSSMYQYEQLKQKYTELKDIIKQKDKFIDQMQDRVNFLQKQLENYLNRPMGQNYQNGNDNQNDRQPQKTDPYYLQQPQKSSTPKKSQCSMHLLQIQSLNKQVQSLRLQASQMNLSINSHRSKNIQLSNELTIVKSENIQLKQNVSKLNEEYTIIQNQLEQANNQIDRVRSELAIRTLHASRDGKQYSKDGKDRPNARESSHSHQLLIVSKGVMEKDEDQLKYKNLVGESQKSRGQTLARSISAKERVYRQQPIQIDISQQANDHPQTKKSSQINIRCTQVNRKNNNELLIQLPKQLPKPQHTNSYTEGSQRNISQVEKKKQKNDQITSLRASYLVQNENKVKQLTKENQSLRNELVELNSRLIIMKKENVNLKEKIGQNYSTQQKEIKTGINRYSQDDKIRIIQESACENRNRSELEDKLLIELEKMREEVKKLKLQNHEIKIHHYHLETPQNVLLPQSSTGQIRQTAKFPPTSQEFIAFGQKSQKQSMARTQLTPHRNQLRVLDSNTLQKIRKSDRSQRSNANSDFRQIISLGGQHAITPIHFNILQGDKINNDGSIDVNQSKADLYQDIFFKDQEIQELKIQRQNFKNKNIELQKQVQTLKQVIISLEDSYNLLKEDNQKKEFQLNEVKKQQLQSKPQAQLQKQANKNLISSQLNHQILQQKQTQIQTLTQEVKQKNQTILSLQSQIHTLKSQLSKQIDQIQKQKQLIIQHELKQIQFKLKETKLNEEINKERYEKNGLAREKEGLEERLRGKEEEGKGLGKRLEEMERENKKLRGQNEVINSNHSSTASKINTLQQQATKLKQSNKLLLQQNTKLKKQIQTYLEKINLTKTSSMQKMSELQSYVQTIIKEVKQTQEKYNSTIEQLFKIKQDNKILSEANLSLSNKNSLIMQELNKARQEARRHEEKLNYLQRNGMIRKERSDNKQNIRSSAQEIQFLKEQVQMLKKNELQYLSIIRNIRTQGKQLKRCAYQQLGPQTPSGSVISQLNPSANKTDQQKKQKILNLLSSISKTFKLLSQKYSQKSSSLSLQKLPTHTSQQQKQKQYLIMINNLAIKNQLLQKQVQALQNQISEYKSKKLNKSNEAAIIMTKQTKPSILSKIKPINSNNNSLASSKSNENLLKFNNNKQQPVIVQFDINNIRGDLNKKFSELKINIIRNMAQINQEVKQVMIKQINQINQMIEFVVIQKG